MTIKARVRGLVNPEVYISERACPRERCGGIVYPQGDSFPHGCRETSTPIGFKRNLEEHPNRRGHECPLRYMMAPPRFATKTAHQAGASSFAPRGQALRGTPIGLPVHSGRSLVFPSSIVNGPWSGLHRPSSVFIDGQSSMVGLWFFHRLSSIVHRRFTPSSMVGFRAHL